MIARQCDITTSRLLISFFLFFFAKQILLTKKTTYQSRPPTKRKTTTLRDQPTTPTHTRPHTHKKSENICHSYHYIQGGGCLGRPLVTWQKRPKTHQKHRETGKSYITDIMGDHNQRGMVPIFYAWGHLILVSGDVGEGARSLPCWEWFSFVVRGAYHLIFC